jgi:hypothetical protein
MPLALAYKLLGMVIGLFEMNINWVTVNTALIISGITGIITFLIKQRSDVTELKNVLYGFRDNDGLVKKAAALETAFSLRSEAAIASPAGRELLAKIDGMLERIVILEQSNRNRRTREGDE